MHTALQTERLGLEGTTTVRLLLVEDPKPLVRALKQALEEEGSAAHVARDGRDGEHKVRGAYMRCCSSSPATWARSSAGARSGNASTTRKTRTGPTSWTCSSATCVTRSTRGLTSP